MQLWSNFGERVAAGSGIEELMEDLGHALADGGEDCLMLGGGNPAFIPEVEAVWETRMKELVSDSAALRKTLAVYDPPRGNPSFLRSLASMLRKEYGWDITEDHLAVTGGGQTAFFALFNLLAGSSPSGSLRKIHFPLMPEYIGYSNQGISPSSLSGSIPEIRKTSPHGFKYHIDFSVLPTDETVAAYCVSRPTNPSGNVLDDEEISKLSAMAKKAGIPLIIDNAYGLPFPNILFRQTTPLWADHHIFVFSLSKLGLPGTRTAVVVAKPQIARAVASMTAVTGLANGNFGQAITRPLIEDGTLLHLSQNFIRPYYEKKMRFARAKVADCFPKESSYALHETEGALFLWLWLPDCPLNSRQFYQKLKEKKVLVVPGEPFFFGLGKDADSWRHRHECIRISFAMKDDVVERGLELIGAEISRAYGM